MTIYGDTLDTLRSLREQFETLAPEAPWDGDLNEWYDYFEADFGVDLTEEEIEEASRGVIHWVKQKYGAAKAVAHRAFIQKVRKNPAAHRKQMRANKKYHRLHKWHDALMRKTSRPGWVRRHIRSHVEIPDDLMSMHERDPGQAFMDLPFELRVTAGKEVGNWGCPKCKYAGRPEPSGKCPKCGAEMVAEAATDSGTELTDKGREKAATAASKKAGVDVPKHYQKSCSMDAFKKNVHYFYRIKSKEWEGSKKEKLQRAIAASYSSLKTACGVGASEKMTPSEIVKAGSS